MCVDIDAYIYGAHGQVRRQCCCGSQAPSTLSLSLACNFSLKPSELSCVLPVAFLCLFSCHHRYCRHQVLCLASYVGVMFPDRKLSILKTLGFLWSVFMFSSRNFVDDKIVFQCHKFGHNWQKWKLWGYRQRTDQLLSHCSDQNIHQNGVRQAPGVREILAHRGMEGMMTGASCNGSSPMVDQEADRRWMELFQDSNLQRVSPSALSTRKFQSFLNSWRKSIQDIHLWE